jgi:hypothetical protein
VAVKKTKKWKTGRLHWPGSNHVHEGEADADAAARLTPLEELEEFEDSPQSDGHKSSADDTIRVGSGSVRMPEQLIDEDRDASSVFRLDAIAVVLLILFAVFVAFIAWQITLMPEK